MGAGEWWRCGWAQDLMLEMRTSRSVDCARTSCRVSMCPPMKWKPLRSIMRLSSSLAVRPLVVK